MLRCDPENWSTSKAQLETVGDYIEGNLARTDCREVRLRRPSRSDCEKLIAESLRQSQLLAGIEANDVFAGVPALHFSDSIDIHDRRAMNPNKRMRPQFSIERVQAPPDPVLVDSYVKKKIVSHGLNPVDRIHAQKDNAPFDLTAIREVRIAATSWAPLAA